nr:DUF1850 domain-containing protein [Rhodoligotrophos defluvii]
MLCLMAGAALATLTLPNDRFTLAWTHSVEKQVWEEDYRVGAMGLTLEEARIHGSGAGMEPGPDAALTADGWWRYHPQRPPLPELTLAASDFTADYRICVEGRCQRLAELIDPGPRSVTLKPCPRSTR